MKWAIPHKAIIKRVASNESRPAPLAKRPSAASRPFSMLFGSEVPVPLLFDAELRESLLTALQKGTQTNLLLATSVTTAWGREVSVRMGGGANKKSPLSIKVKPTPIGKGELGLEIDAEISSSPDVPGGKKTHWNLRVRAGHTLMLPLAQPNLEKQLVLLVQPKIVELRPATQFVTPPFAGPIPPGNYRPVPQASSPPVRRPVEQSPVAATSPEEEAVAILQMLILDVDGKTAREVVSKSRTTDLKLSDVDVQFPKEKGSKKRSPKKLKTQMQTFLIDASLGKLFVADLKKQDDSFKVISRPQIRTIVGVGLATEIRGGDDPTKQVAGVGNFKLHVTPKWVGEDLMVNSHLILTGAGDSGIKVEAEVLQKCQPGNTAVIVLGGKEGERSIILLTDLVHVVTAKSGPAPPVAQVLPTPLGFLPPPKSVDPRNVMQQWQQSITQQPGVAVWKAAPAKPTNMRLVTLQSITGSSVAPGDTVDVLLAYEDGDPAKFKVEPVCESVTVHASTKTRDGSTTVTLLVDKDVVATLLWGEIKGTLRLSLHKSTVQHRNQSSSGPTMPDYAIPTMPDYAMPNSSRLTLPPGTPIVYRDNGTWGPADTPIQASGVQSPQPMPTRQRPKSEVQQVLEEVREMRKMIQGLRDDMNQLRNSVRATDGESAQRTDLWLPKGTSRTISRERRIARVDGFDPNVMGVQAVSPNSVRFIGHRPGRTTVELFFEGDNRTPEKIVVAVVTEKPIGNLKPADAVLKAAQHEPPLPGLRHRPLKPIARPQGPHTDIRVSVNHSHLVKRDRKFSRIAVATPEIADFVQYSLNQAGIIAKKPGSTNLMIWYEDDPVPETFEIVVVGFTNDDPFSSTGSKEADTPTRRIELALKKKVSLDIDDGTLMDAMRSLRDTVGINIAVDSPAIEQEGIRTDHKVSIHLEDVTLSSALKILLTPLNLVANIQDEVLMITSPRAKGTQTVIAYKVADLISQVEDETKSFDDLISLITTVIKPNSWQEVGGAGSIAANEPTMSLVIRQTRDAHEEIQQLFSALRKWNFGVAPNAGGPQGNAAASPKWLSESSPVGRLPESALAEVERVWWRPASKEVLPEAMKQRISLDEKDGILGDVLREITKLIGVKLVIDQERLAAEGVNENAPVSIYVDNIRAASTLELILEPLKLGAVLEEGNVLRVTSLSRLNALPTVRVYSVFFLLADPEVLDLKKLQALITTSIQPDSWEEVGGSGTLTPNEKTKSLVIRQSRETHEKIRVLLEDLSNPVVTPEEAATQAGPQKTAPPNGKDTTEKTAEEISPNIGVPIEILRPAGVR
jgi:hypothetical protein